MRVAHERKMENCVALVYQRLFMLQHSFGNYCIVRHSVSDF
jgi:hypothetical protein